MVLAAAAQRLVRHLTNHNLCRSIAHGWLTGGSELGAPERHPTVVGCKTAGEGSKKRLQQAGGSRQTARAKQGTTKSVCMVAATEHKQQQQQGQYMHVEQLPHMRGIPQQGQPGVDAGAQRLTQRACGTQLHPPLPKSPIAPGAPRGRHNRPAAAQCTGNGEGPTQELLPGGSRCSALYKLKSAIDYR